MSKKRRQHSAELKAKAGLEAPSQFFNIGDPKFSHGMVWPVADYELSHFQISEWVFSCPL